MKYNLSISLFLLIFFSLVLIKCHKDDTVQGTCVDGIKNQGESGIDCGGPFPPRNAVAVKIPTISTTVVSSVTATKAMSGGTVTSNGNASVTTAGVCWSTAANPTVADAHTNDYPFPNSFSSSITGLNITTTYYLRAYAINSA